MDKNVSANIKEKIDALLQKIRNDKDFSRKFMENPVKAVEDILGVDLPEEQIQAIINGVKSKITAENIANAAGKLGNLGNLFGGKKSS